MSTNELMQKTLLVVGSSSFGKQKAELRVTIKVVLASKIDQLLTTEPSFETEPKDMNIEIDSNSQYFEVDLPKIKNGNNG